MDILQKAFRQYESAMGSAAATGDRLCQMEAMDGAARCMEALRLQHKICNCRPLEFNTRLLEVAGSVGAKVNCQYRSRIALCPPFIPLLRNRTDGGWERAGGRWERGKSAGRARRAVKSISSPFVRRAKTWEFLPLFLSLAKSQRNSVWRQ